MKQMDGWMRTLKVSVPGEAALLPDNIPGGLGDFVDFLSIFNLL